VAIDEDYGTVSIYYEYWDNNKNYIKPIEKRPCELEDFGLGENVNS
jgi:hypothetical protein